MKICGSAQSESDIEHPVWKELDGKSAHVYWHACSCRLAVQCSLPESMTAREVKVSKWRKKSLAWKIYIYHFCISQIIYQAATEGKLKEKMLKTLYFFNWLVSNN